MIGVPQHAARSNKVQDGSLHQADQIMISTKISVKSKKGKGPASLS
jgi:hypothetical protein